MEQFTHFDEHGQSRMVDVSEKAITQREAVARGCVRMQPKTFEMILNKAMSKGDVLEVARIAGIMGAKQTCALIPLCHPLNLNSVGIAYYLHAERAEIEIEATARVSAKTGVEMEALTAVTVAALTIYDMCKAVDRGMVISDIRLIKKSGGKSGIFLVQEMSNSQNSA
ncbi:molybdenum cofactor biosynthesis protein C [Candidatus Moduliflexus flocculans]|uniref:Cyclic pyranopterin monophosphate synthase n=1 Tax=Candidatus Moduliflexus flocculans TaxID=1499966 RepID=A0A0S6W5H4_9BACT|nr:molybdenum cofactor biosynthesis protein C [Candidatus Moduliflexus flocculans]